MTPARRLGLWLPPLVLMAVIFALSAQPSLNSGLGVIDKVGRKFVHAGEYALLCALWWRALRTQVSARAALIGAFAMAVAYSATDELHQHFVTGRHGTPVDVLIDAVGAGLTVLWLRSRARRRGDRSRGRPPATATSSSS
ncbi:MAG: VanZ family protein [Thermoleophilaceae bacterium]